MRLESDIKLDYSDVLLRPKRSTLKSRKQVDLNRLFKFRHARHTFSGFPLMAANMDGVGTLTMAETLASLRILTAMRKHYDQKTLIKHFQSNSNLDYSIYSMGTTAADLKKFRQVNEAVSIKMVCIDVANGYTENFINFVADFRQKFPEKVIIAGNVATADITEELILKGADIVKVGIGPGSACTTRLVAGVGIPQLSAIIACADAAHGLDAHIIADGGCSSSGDVAKAFAANADFVMLGGLLAGTDEGDQEVVEKKIATEELDEQQQRVVLTQKFVKFYGMSSTKANDLYSAGLKNYRAAEGREALIPYKGKVVDIIQSIEGGLRSACTYVGARRLKDLSKCATFVRCNRTHNQVFVQK